MKYIKIKIVFYFLITVILCFNLSVIGFAQTDSSTPDKKVNVVNINSNDNNSTIKLQKGDLLSLNLKSNISTGYSWNYISMFDENILTEISSDFIEPIINLRGTPGIQVFKINAVGIGKTSIKLGYFRSWEPDNIIDTFSLNIIIRQNQKIN
ncbi:MAG: protease inhibitor I42 family protein [Clostridiales bacterium]